MKGHIFHVRRKLKENRGLFYKKASENQLVPFVNSVLELSHYSLSLILLDT